MNQTCVRVGLNITGALVDEEAASCFALGMAGLPV